MNAEKLVKQMHEKFGISYDGSPRVLSKEEVDFRVNAMLEELFEYIESVYAMNEDFTEWLYDHHRNITNNLSATGLNKEPDLAAQFDALIDLSVFTLGTLERQGLPFDKGFEVVMQANIQKEIAGTNENSKRGYKSDLVKPDGWTPPNLDQLLDENHNHPCGIIVLDGPDGAGKTTLATRLIKEYGGVIIHSTWSPELEQRMDEYMLSTFKAAKQLMDQGKLVILDRLWLSEICYSEVYRGGSKWEDLPRCMDELLKSVNALNVVCLPNNRLQFCEHFEALKTRREEMYSTNMGNIYDAYWSLMSGYYLGGSQYSHHIKDKGGLALREDYFQYDFFDQGDSKGILEEIITALKKVQSE